MRLADTLCLSYHFATAIAEWCFFLAEPENKG